LKASGNGSPRIPPDDVIFGHCGEMLRVRQFLEKACPTDAPILIEGSAGSGKETLARWIHERSRASSGPFLKLNCAAIPPLLLESELYGYEKGAFTGAVTSKPGRVELAEGGTLLLDEIGNLSLTLQAKLLQLLQDGSYCRLGGETEKHLGARIICTNNGAIERLVGTGRFRQDLFYRISVFRVEVPALRERRPDIPVIAAYIFEELKARYGKDNSELPARMLNDLQKREWNGNIRELENRIASYLFLGDEGTAAAVRAGAIARTATMQEDGTIPLKCITRQACKEMGREVILNTLRANHWNRRQTAKDLKISYRALLCKIREAGIPPRRRMRSDEENAGSKPPAAF